MRAGETLAVFRAPDVEHELQQALRRRDELLWEREALGVDSLRRERALVTRAAVFSQARLISALEQRLAKLTVKAEIPVRVVDVSTHLHPGGWIAEGEPLLVLRGEADSQTIVAYVDEAEVGRLAVGAAARFVAEPGIWPDLEAEIVDIPPAGLERIEKDLLTSSQGGGVDVRVTAAGEAVPLRATYMIVLAPLGPDVGTVIPRQLRGQIVIEAKPQSLLKGIWIRALALLRREAGMSLAKGSCSLPCRRSNMRMRVAPAATTSKFVRVCCRLAVAERLLYRWLRVTARVWYGRANYWWFQALRATEELFGIGGCEPTI